MSRNPPGGRDGPPSPRVSSLCPWSCPLLRPTLTLPFPSISQLTYKLCADARRHTGDTVDLPFPGIKGALGGELMRPVR